MLNFALEENRQTKLNNRSVRIVRQKVATEPGFRVW